jgi:hypothetical protein
MAGRTDWVSSPDWSPEIEAEFEAKLRRARNKGEYLRVKGVTLIQQEDQQRREAGRILLRRLVAEYPDTLTIAWAYESLGDADALDGLDGDAENRYREAIDAYRRTPGVQGNAEIKLAGLIARTKQRSKYNEAETILDRSRPVWKIEHFWVHLARARIAADLGDAAVAGTQARLALTAEADPKPQAPRHPALGHVRTDAETLTELRRLARST